MLSFSLLLVHFVDQLLHVGILDRQRLELGVGVELEELVRQPLAGLLQVLAKNEDLLLVYLSAFLDLGHRGDQRAHGLRGALLTWLDQLLLALLTQMLLISVLDLRVGWSQQL